MIYKSIVNGKIVESEIDNALFDEHYHVIVAGVGTAGACAVIAAASQGVSVLGIERLSGVGGMGTMGYVDAYYYGLAGGVQVEIDTEAEHLCKEMFLNPVEAKKYLLENIIKGNQADLSFETVVTGVFMDGNAIKGISVLSKGIQRRISCGVLIDATADAAVCILAGCKTNCGRESDGKTRPFTSVKVSLDKEGKITRTNHDSGYVDQYDPFELSEGIIQAHTSQLMEEFSNKEERIIFFAPYIGIREGYIIEAEKMINLQEVIAGIPEEEPLFYSYSDFDKHGKDNALETEALEDLHVAANLSTVCFSVPVTIKSMIPRGYKSIIAAGRHIGTDHDVAGLNRMKRDMQKCGESAGICAALAVKNGVQPIEAAYEDIKRILEESGCLTEKHNVGIMFDDNFRREKIQWMTNQEDIKAALSTKMPGIAIYSCKLLGGRIVPFLKDYLNDNNQLLRYNSAIALGLTCDEASLPVLREIVENRDAFYFEDCRRTNQFRTSVAIYLLGKLGDRDSIPVLKEILCSEEEYKRDLYHFIKEPSYKLNTSKNFNELYFQVISHSAVSLIKIIKKNPDILKEGVEILKEAFKDNRHIENTTTLPGKTYEYETMGNIKSYVLDFINKS